MYFKFMKNIALFCLYPKASALPHCTKQIADSNIESESQAVVKNRRGCIWVSIDTHAEIQRTYFHVIKRMRP
ncbi:MAG: hypothetical protein AXW14_17085 [Alteromonas sp. Nap_26]|nr:MAG: hypothetical protein AXW14_17085 [Alteromonas sp. Nap_26]